MRWFTINRMAWQQEGGAGGAPADAPAAEAPAGGAPAAEAPPTLLSEKPAEAPTDKPAEKPAEAPADKPAEKPAEAPVEMKAEDYKIEVPEGLDKDDPILGAFLEGAAKGGMDNESVNAVIKTLGPKLAERLAEPFKAWERMTTDWLAAVKSNDEFGGAKIDASKATIWGGINATHSADEAAELRTALDQTGAGNHPAVIRALYRMSSRLTEQGAVTGNAPSASRDPLALLYPTHAAKGG